MGNLHPHDHSFVSKDPLNPLKENSL